MRKTATIDVAKHLSAAKPPGVFDGLIRAYAPPTETITCHLAEQKFEFAGMTDRRRLNDIKRRAQAFAESRPGERCPDPEARHFYDADEDTLLRCFVLSELSVEPKLSVLDLLELAKRAALGFEALEASFNLQHGGALAQREFATLETAKARITSDVAWRNRLMIARDVWGRHPLELEGGTFEDMMMLDMVALALVESEEMKKNG